MYRDISHVSIDRNNLRGITKTRQLALYSTSWIRSPWSKSPSLNNVVTYIDRVLFSARLCWPRNSHKSKTLPLQVIHPRRELVAHVLVQSDPVTSSTYAQKLPILYHLLLGNVPDIKHRNIKMCGAWGLSSTQSYLRHCMEVSTQLHVSTAFSAGKYL